MPGVTKTHLQWSFPAQKHGLAISGNIAHIITTPHHFDSSKIDSLIIDVIADLKMHKKALIYHSFFSSV